MKSHGYWRACSVLLAFLLLLIGYRPSAAASRQADLCALAAESTAIVQGRVERIVSGWQDPARKLIYSEIGIRISDVLLGSRGAGSLLSLHVRGGQVDDLNMIASEEAAFTEGEEVLLFVSTTARGDVVTAGAQGKFQVLGDLAVQQSSQLAYQSAELIASLRALPGELRPGENGCAITPIMTDAPERPSQGTAGARAVNRNPEGYVYNGYKWSGSDPMEEPYLINVNTGRASGSNGSVAQFHDAIVAAGDTWTAVPSAGFTFRYGGISTVASTAYDGVNVVYWENMGSSSILAEATTWYSSGRIVESDIRFNDSQPWDATGALQGGEADVQSVALHEMGHWLSLGHDTDPTCSSCPAAGPAMCSCYRMGSLKRGLASNDAAGINAIYPQSVAATSTPTATPQRAATPTRTPTATLRPIQVPDWWREFYLPLFIRK